MKPAQKRVLAQRKFAQGAIIPAASTSAERRPEPPERPERLNEPVVVSTRLPASTLLDQIAFKNLHIHLPNEAKEMRVLLDRLPTEGTALDAFRVPTGRAPIKLPQKKRARLSLRNRSISRDSFSSLSMPKWRAQRRRAHLLSDASEDNRPLKYLLKEKRKEISKKRKLNKNKVESTVPPKKMVTRSSTKAAKPATSPSICKTEKPKKKRRTPKVQAPKMVEKPLDQRPVTREQGNQDDVPSADNLHETAHSSTTEYPFKEEVQQYVRDTSVDMNAVSADVIEIKDEDDDLVEAGQADSQERGNENAVANDVYSDSEESCRLRYSPDEEPESLLYESEDTITTRRKSILEGGSVTLEQNEFNETPISNSLCCDTLASLTVIKTQAEGASEETPQPKRWKGKASEKTIQKGRKAATAPQSNETAQSTGLYQPSTSSLPSTSSSQSPTSSARLSASSPQPGSPRANSCERIATRLYNQRLPSLVSSSPCKYGTVREGRRFTPTWKEADNPIKYATHIKTQNPGMGICVIKLPEDFKPPLVTNADVPVFKMSSQYINRMFQRWSLATRQLITIKSVQRQRMKSNPLFEGVELDLVKLYNCVQECDGLKPITLLRDLWTTVIGRMRLGSRGQQYKKLQRLYFRYILCYETLTYLEREDILHKVVKCWERRQRQLIERALNPLWRQHMMMELKQYHDEGTLDAIEQACAEAEDCIAHNRASNLKRFRKIAERAKAVFLPKRPCPTVEEVEKEYWRVVMLGTDHVCVNTAAVDTTEYGHGFPANVGEAYGAHNWNLKRICRSTDNVLSFLEPTLGVSAPTLHFGMIYSTSCFHMDPHMLPWIEYLHEGPPKIWYSVPESQSSNFREAVKNLCPTAVQNKSIWLPSDITMIPPHLLQQHNVTLDRVVQHPGEFVVVYPNTYSASIDTGMTISEGVYFAPHSWLQKIEHIFKELRDNCESTMFPVEQLLMGLAIDSRTPPRVLTQTYNALHPLLAAELRHRAAATKYGLPLLTTQQVIAQGLMPRYMPTNECFYCRCTIHLSRVIGLTETSTSLCLEHGVRLYAKMKDKHVNLARAFCILIFGNDELDSAIKSLQQRICSWEPPSTSSCSQ